jgi:DHA2 family metal-tetracycline-proton antiporter-like MFS transporter
MKANTKLTITLCLFIFFAVVNNTMFNVAMPFIKSIYDLTAGQVSLVSVTYLAIFSVGTIIYGKLADFFPLRTLYIIGASLLIGGSFIGYFADSFLFILIGRIVQAAGGAAIPSLTMLVFHAFYSVEKRAVGMTLLASTASLGTGAGPVLGGFITSFFGYKGLFLITASVIFLLPFLFHLMPKGQSKPLEFDFFGCFLLICGIFMLVVGISINLNLFIGGFLCLVIFVFYIQRAKISFIDLSLLKNKMFCCMLLVGLFSFLVSIGNLFLLPMLLKQVNGMTAFSIGLCLLPGSILSFISGKYVKKLYDTCGAIYTLGGVLGLLLAGFFCTATFAGGSYLLIVGFSLFAYIGFAAVQVVMGNYMFELLSKAEVNVGMGLYNLCAFVGGALGPALTGKFLDLQFVPVLNPWNHSSIFVDGFMLLAFIVILTGAFLWAANRRYDFPSKKAARVLI